MVKIVFRLCEGKGSPERLKAILGSFRVSKMEMAEISLLPMLIDNPFSPRTPFI